MPTARAPATRADVVRQIGVAVSAVLATAGAFIGSGAVWGTPIAEAAGGVLAADATLLAPGGPAFAIWSVIYTGLLALAVWQLLPGQRTDPRQRATGWWVAVSMLLNAAWIFAVQGALLGLTVVIIGALVAVLCLILVRLVRTRPRGWVEAVVVDGTIGLYLGWSSVATAANVAAVLVDAGIELDVLGPEAWAVVVLAAVAAIGVGLAWWSGGRLAVAVAMAWGLAWIAVGRATGEPPSTIVAVAAAGAAAVVLVAAVVARLRHGTNVTRRR